eukprot:CAMPEP_0202451168 /NCGR_PEP_ID=MMETSP1360-20130828/9656_1 /ASSEMBLY_ACC=CAM_ASM_000848 /TAXON_ID=515479 /ORGANISM="Licmophora paradoxa, Strain CCMP2313" /LENGTH=260 /DNA_ID=CAMNT_0049069671 /DNA_START=704 /DNA_END=1486 /DNA_ORIENTATION=-
MAEQVDITGKAFSLTCGGSDLVFPQLSPPSDTRCGIRATGNSNRIFSGSPALVTFIDIDFSATEANMADGSGGLFHLTGGQTMFRNNRFENGKSSADGGAIYASGIAATVYLTSNVEFRGNSAAQNGGAIAVVNGARVESKSSKFRSNSATGKGGALYASNATALVNSNSFLGNTAMNGGAIGVSNSMLTVDYNSRFQVGNMATGGAGKHIFIVDDDEPAAGGTFVRCTSEMIFTTRVVPIFCGSFRRTTLAAALEIAAT